ncbi:ribonucleoside-diphosphate reductase small chain, partial [Phtheirospermum japonicum]
AIETVPCVEKKAKWALRWIDSFDRFAERIIVFSCVERMLLPDSFCVKFWLKKRGLSVVDFIIDFERRKFAL